MRPAHPADSAGRTNIVLAEGANACTHRDRARRDALCAGGLPVDLGGAPVRTVLVIHSGAEVPANRSWIQASGKVSSPDLTCRSSLSRNTWSRTRFGRGRIAGLQGLHPPEVPWAPDRRGDRDHRHGADFVLHHHGELFPEAPIVFVGVNQPENGVTPGPGLTGLTVGIAYGETLKLALEPAGTGACSSWPTAGVGNHRSRSCPTPRLLPRSASRLTERTLPKLVAAIKAVPPNSVILYLAPATGPRGTSYAANEIARLRDRVAPVPSASDFYVGSGVVGGVVRGTRRDRGFASGRWRCDSHRDTGSGHSDRDVAARDHPRLAAGGAGESSDAGPAGARILRRPGGIDAGVSWQRPLLAQTGLIGGRWCRPEDGGGRGAHP